MSTNTGGLETTTLVDWDDLQQKKIDALCQNLIAGKADIPEGMGKFYAAYVAAASLAAFLSLAENGPPSEELLAQLLKNSLKMLETVCLCPTEHTQVA